MTRYMRRGVSKIRFAPTIANKAAPTTAEVTAGTDLTPQLADVNGFEFANSPISTPVMSDSFTPQVSGEDTAAASSMTFYEDDVAANNTIRTSLAKGTTGFILLYPYGVPAAAQKVEVWPVRVTSVVREWSTGNDPARYTIGFAIVDVPNLDATQAA